MTRLAIIGYGKMGHAIEQLAPERGFDVVARIDPHGGDSNVVDRTSLKGADVAVEFTTPGAAAANIRSAIEAGCAIVVGTTGWYDARPEIEQLVKARNGALLVAPNFSVGVAAFTEIVKAAANVFRSTPGFDVHMVETHHAAKKDAPSGTATNLARLGGAELGREIPITSVRTGSVPGTHELIFDGAFESIRLEHVARDRRVFADGALLAAKWLVGKKGVFTMSDVLRP